MNWSYYLDDFQNLLNSETFVAMMTKNDDDDVTAMWVVFEFVAGAAEQYCANFRLLQFLRPIDVSICFVDSETRS